MDGRSIWTGKRSPSLIEVRLDARLLLGGGPGEQVWLVEPEHEAEMRAFIAHAQRSEKAFWIFLGIGFFLCAGGALLAIAWPVARWAAVAGLLVLAGMFFRYPFSTPETIRMLGMRKARQAARIGAAILLLLAIGIAMMPLG